MATEAKASSPDHPPRYFVLFTPVGWAVNDREEGREYMLFGLDGYRLAKESADELNEAVESDA